MISENQNPELIRRAYYAGSFYPADPVELAEVINQYLGAVTGSKSYSEIIGMVAPHAGYVYSGPCAAHAYGQISKSKYDVVILIAPSHQVFFDSVSVFNGGAYETPLGVVYVDTDLAKEIGNVHPKVVLSGAAHTGGRSPEHSLEVHLPFLQTVLGDFPLIPIVMGNQEMSLCTALGEVLAAKLAGRRALIVASSDLSHYYHAREAATMDRGVIDAIEKFDWKLLHDRVSSGVSQACGAGPVIACMYASKRLGAIDARVLRYTHSGEISGDESEVVGYLSAILHK